MTGQMAFRVPNGGRVFSGAGGPTLIEANRLTLPEMLRDKGYTNACFGKWHIGLTFFDQDGKAIHEDSLNGVKRIDYSRRIDGGGRWIVDSISSSGPHAVQPLTGFMPGLTATEFPRLPFTSDNKYEANALLEEYHLPDTAPETPGQLFDLENDSGEKQNLSSIHPEIAEEMNALLQESLAQGRSAPDRIE